MAAQRKKTIHHLMPLKTVFKTSVSLSGVLLTPWAAQAQITPDQSLGAEASQVDRNVNVRGALGDRINGGAIRGANHFHSFSDFNVLSEQRVYFSNQAGVENIITRVTGGNGSNILGTLGVDGQANLFLINPNGVVFGPNAQLDVAGSFWAGTSDRVIFSNGESFGTHSGAVPALVEVNIPMGLQMGKNAIAMVRNEAKLTAGKDLGLVGGSVVSTGSLQADQVKVAAVVGNAEVAQVVGRSATVEAKQDVVLNSSQVKTTGDLTVRAEGTVQARDSVTQPLSVFAGGNLTVQGNQKVDIFALNHPTPAFQAGGDLNLISDGIVSGDSHFTSGGNFSILKLNGQAGNFLSLYDPIVRSNRDVEFGAYSGASLKVEAKGSIKATGDITITTPDATIPATDPDAPILTGQPALILRSGVATIASSTGITSDFTESNATTPGDITLQKVTVNSATSPGRVILESKNNGTINLGDVLDTKQGQTDLDARTINVKPTGVNVNGTVNFNNGRVQGGPINGGVGNEIFNFNGGSIANGLQIDAKDGTNIFNLKGTTFGAGVNLKGGAGSDTVTVDGANNIFTISGNNSGSVRGTNVSGVEFYTGSGTDTVQGRSTSDIFQITGSQSLSSSGIAFSGIQTIDGAGGTDTINKTILPQTITLTGNKQGNFSGTGFNDIEIFQGSGTDTINGSSGAETFTVTGANQVTVSNIAFSGIQAIDGRNGGDTYQLNDGVPTSAIAINDTGTVAGNIDLLDYSAYTIDPNVNLAAIGAVGIEEIRGRTAGNSTITALNQANSWTLNGNRSGTIGALRFSNFNQLIGGDLGDVFAVSAGATGFASINGGAGDNSINNSIANQTVAILGPNQGLFNGIAFQNISGFQGSGTDTLLGTAGDDTFLAAATNTFAVNGVNVTGVNGVDGLAGTDTVVNTNGPQLVAITGNNQVSTLGKSFRAIEQFTGSGGDTLAGTSGNDTFSITRTNTVQAAGIAFTGVQSLAGGDGDDIFSLDGGSLTGMISGGGGVNTLLGQDLAISSPFNSDEFVLTGSQKGTVNNSGVQFIPSPLPPIIPDQFIPFTTSTQFQEIQRIDGRGGIDTLKGTPAAETFDFGSLSLTADVAVVNVEALDGGGGNDILQGDATSNIFNVTGPNSGSVGGLTFSNIPNLKGLGGDDRFILSTGGSITGQLSGGNGQDIFELNGGSITGLIDGGGDLDLILGSSGDDVFQLTGPNSGSVNGASFTQVETADARDGNDVLRGTSGADNFVVADTFIATNTGFQAKNFETIEGLAGDDLFTMRSGSLATLLGGEGNDVVNLEGGVLGSVSLGEGNDGLVLKPGGGVVNSVSLGNGDDTVRVEGNSQITGALDGGAGNLSILGQDNLQGLPTGVNSISGTGVLTLGAIAPKTGIVINNGATDPNAVVITPTNLQAIKSGFTQVILEGSRIGIQSNVSTTGNAFRLNATTGNIDAQNALFNTNDGNLSLFAPGGQVNLNNATIGTTSGNLAITAPTLSLNNGNLTTQSGSLTLNAPTQTLANNSRIASTTGPIVIKSNAQTLDNGSTIATTTGPISIGTVDQVISGGSSITSQAGAIGITAQTQTLNGGSRIGNGAGTIDIRTQTQTLNGGSTITTNSGNISSTAQTIRLRDASKITSTSGNIEITAPTLELKGNTVTTSVALDQRSQPQADRAEIATRSFIPGVASGNLTVNTTNLILDNGALIAETGRGAANGNVTINFPSDPAISPAGSLNLSNSSVILAQGDRRSNGDVKFTGNAVVKLDAVRSPGKDGNDIITNANPDRSGGAILFEAKDNPGKTFTPLAQSFSNAGFATRKAVAGNGTNDLSTNEAVDLPPPTTNQSDTISAEFTDPNKLVSAECQPSKGGSDRRNQFSVAGKGGLPSNPTAVLGAGSSQDDWVTLPVPKAPPKTIAQNPPGGLKPPTNKPAQCLQSWMDSQNVSSPK